MPRAVVDTNVFVRALLRPGCSDGMIFKQFLSGTVDAFYSQTQFAEIGRVLTYPRLAKKYHLTAEMVLVFLKTIAAFGKLVSPEKTITLCRDADDNDLLSVAVSIASGPAVYLITADKDLLILQGKVNNVEIVTPQEFLKREE